ncbi:hypothetical protein M0R89_01155 [Halorussus limi]|uniref:Uncharacterized protein n=1 Tax=Halorussus limi TaxID=2938695 RepID=A0A8U0HVE7_9EURY|nr:hypothetical protein [Halorussus limi]UPV74693.1 hypothetical protein M0R89_01155 [Halorussus limi]
MVVSEESVLVDFDADAALAAAREASDESVRLCVEYTPEEFHTLWADETTMATYAGDEDEMRDHFEEVHRYVHVDFTERDLFADILRDAGEIRAFVTYAENGTFVRTLLGQQGLFLSLAPDTDVTAVVQAVESRVE